MSVGIIRSKFTPGKSDKFTEFGENKYILSEKLKCLENKRKKLEEMLRSYFPDEVERLAGIISEKKDIILKKSTGSEFVFACARILPKKMFELILELYVVDNMCIVVNDRKMNLQEYEFIDPVEDELINSI